MNIGDLVCVHGSYNFTDENGVKYSNVYKDIAESHEKMKVTPARPKFLVPLKTPGILLEIVEPAENNRPGFRWAKIIFPQGVGYVSYALLRTYKVL